jgi:hypothetical protein
MLFKPLFIVVLAELQQEGQTLLIETGKRAHDRPSWLTVAACAFTQAVHTPSIAEDGGRLKQQSKVSPYYLCKVCLYLWRTPCKMVAGAVHSPFKILIIISGAVWEWVVKRQK